MAQDMALEGLLAAARSRLKPADLPALLAGVSAAPEGLDPDAWMALVAPQVGPELKAHLRPLYQAARQEGPGKATIADRLQALVDRLWLEGTGSANRVARAVVLEEPPHIDRGEVTDKGSINQRAVLRTRADLVEMLYTEPLAPQVLKAKG